MSLWHEQLTATGWDVCTTNGTRLAPAPRDIVDALRRDLVRGTKKDEGGRRRMNQSKVQGESQASGGVSPLIFAWYFPCVTFPQFQFSKGKP